VDRLAERTTLVRRGIWRTAADKVLCRERNSALGSRPGVSRGRTQPAGVATTQPRTRFVAAATSTELVQYAVDAGRDVVRDLSVGWRGKPGQPIQMISFGVYELQGPSECAKALTDIRINAADPGYTATDLNANTGPQTVTEGTDAIVGLATEGPGHGSGRFVDRDGEIKWS
jgi:hypothetical protein